LRRRGFGWQAKREHQNAKISLAFITIAGEQQHVSMVEGYASIFSCFNRNVELRDWWLSMLMNGQVRVA